MYTVLKNEKDGLYFEEGKGFVSQLATATRFEQYEQDGEIEDIVDSADRLGISVIEEDAPEGDGGGECGCIKQNPDGSSFAVRFIRSKDVKADGSIAAHKPSARRFASKEEAEHHALRFVKIEKHVGATVIQTSDPVNAYVNKVTGKTNPEIGKKRVNR